MKDTNLLSWKTAKIFLALVVSFLPVYNALAQSGGVVIINQPNLADYPYISFFMETYDVNGNFVTSLEVNEVQIQENGINHSPLELNLIEPGVEIILSINESPYLNNNNVNGVSYYEQIMTTISNWAANHSSENNDNFSMATNTGLQVIRLEDPLEWQNALNNYEVNLLNTQSSVNSLSQALDLATDTNVETNKKKVILYITPLPDSEDITVLQNLAGQAVQLGVTVFVWLVAPTTYNGSEEIQPLVQLTDDTDGTFFLYSGAEELPFLDTYLQPLRYHYQVVYRSSIIQSGRQQFMVKVNSPTLQSDSPIESFTLDVLPPNPIFLAPPVNIERKWTETEKRNVEELEPKDTVINSIIEFPDGFDRNIKISRLYIDEKLVVENINEPFTRFIWDLEPYSESGEHQLRIEVEDETGLVGKSIDSLVYLTVEPPKPDVIGGLISGRRVLIGFLLFIVLLIMTSFLIVSLRRPRGLFDVVGRVVDRKNSIKSLKVEKTSTAGYHKSAAAQAETIPLVKKGFDAPARLVRVTFDGLLDTQESILVNTSQLSFGQDKSLVNQLVDSPSVDPIHAIIFRKENDEFTIEDAGSIAGTWVNYNRVPEGGLSLRHGDLIFMGLVVFRFELKNPSDIPKLTVQPYNEDTK